MNLESLVFRRWRLECPLLRPDQDWSNQSEDELIVSARELAHSGDLESLRGLLGFLNKLKSWSEVSSKPPFATPKLPPVTPKAPAVNSVFSQVLFAAAEDGSLAVARFCINEAKVNVNAVDRRGLGALHHAVMRRDNGKLGVLMVRLLIEAGCKVRKSVLHVCSNEFCISPLVENGADIDAVSVDGFTPLSVAVSCDRQEMVMGLIKAGAKITSSLLFKATSSFVVSELCSHGADPNVKDNQGRTPLVCAVECGDRRMARALLENKADPQECLKVRAKLIKGSDEGKEIDGAEETAKAEKKGAEEAKQTEEAKSAFAENKNDRAPAKLVSLPMKQVLKPTTHLASTRPVEASNSPNSDPNPQIVEVEGSPQKMPTVFIKKSLMADENARPHQELERLVAGERIGGGLPASQVSQSNSKTSGESSQIQTSKASGSSEVYSDRLAQYVALLGSTMSPEQITKAAHELLKTLEACRDSSEDLNGTSSDWKELDTVVASLLPVSQDLAARALAEEDSRAKSASSNTEVMCTVCLSRKRSVVLMPCRHLCVCDDCSRKLSKSDLPNSGLGISGSCGRCPVCRTAVDSTVAVFL